MNDVGHAYREAAIRPRCSTCGSLADGECPRCGAALCGEHVPLTARRCQPCEAAWQARRKPWARRFKLVCGVGLVLAGLTLVLFGRLMGPRPPLDPTHAALALTGCICACVVGGLPIAVVGWIPSRRRFLRERLGR